MADAHEFRYRVVESLSEPGEPLLFNEGGFREYGTEDVRIRYLGNVKESWENGFIRAEHRGKNHEVQLKKVGFQDQIGSKRVLQALWPEHLIARSGGFVFHCSCIECNGRAIVFTAPSETGKSTQADLWNRHRGARIINGDRSAIRCTEEGIMACGIPYSGSSPYCENRTLPLACVVYLAQSPETGIRRLHGAEAFLRVWEGCSINTWKSALPLQYLPLRRLQ